MRYKTLIVGLGQIGMGYDLHLDPAAFVYSHARAFSLHSSFVLAGGVDTDPAHRATFEQTYQCPAYSDLDMALSQQQPDIVVIAVPTPLHCATVQRVLAQSKPRAILCEKPLSYDLDEARTMVQDCAARGVALYANYIRRSVSGAIEVKRRLDAGEISTPVKGVVWYSKGFLHNGSHFFNLLEYWLGAVTNAQIIATGRLWDDHDPEPDVRVVFERGAMVFLAAREEDFSHYTIELLATNGRLRYEKGGHQIIWQAACPDPNFKGYTVLSDDSESIESGLSRYQWHVAEQLAAALEGRNFYLCSGAESLLTLENMQHILEMK